MHCVSCCGGGCDVGDDNDDSKDDESSTYPSHVVFILPLGAYRPRFTFVSINFLSLHYHSVTLRSETMSSLVLFIPFPLFTSNIPFPFLPTLPSFPIINSPHCPILPAFLSSCLPITVPSPFPFLSDLHTFSSFVNFYSLSHSDICVPHCYVSLPILYFQSIPYLHLSSILPPLYHFPTLFQSTHHFNLLPPL